MANSAQDVPIQALLRENRKFPPPKAFANNALINKPSIYAQAQKNYVRFWEQRARDLHWFRPWRKALDWNPPYAKWFVGGKLNVADNCLDRHVSGPRRTKAAIIWEGEPGDSRVLTYWDLYREVNRFAAALKRHGVKKGDRVTIYMPMVPELPIAMLACARIGAPHSVIFGGFSPEAVRERIHDADSSLVITADGGFRRGSIVPLKKNVDEALRGAPGVKTVIVLKRTGQAVAMQHGRDVWWDEFVKGAPARCPAEPMDSEDLLYLLYTSGSTGKPKGIIHTTGGYLTGVTATHKWIFDLHEEDVYWCTADIGWVTGHSYIVYAPLANGATTVMYEGTPDYPDKDRFWRIVEKYGITIIYTAPTAIRTFMKWGEEYPKRCDPRASGCSGRSASRSTPRRGSGTGRSLAAGGARWSTPGGRRRRDRFSSRRSPASPSSNPARRRGRSPASRRRSSTRRATRRSRATSSSRSPGRRCCAASGVTPIATSSSTGRSTTISISPATAPSATRTATSGCSAAWTTS